MPAPVIAAFTQYLSSSLNCSVWDGEVPRYDAHGVAINPNTVSVPSSWPVMFVEMPESGFNREWNTEDPYEDWGILLLRIYATTRQALEDPSIGLVTRTEQLLASVTNWRAGLNPLLTGGPVTNPYGVIDCLLRRWTVVQEKTVRTNLSQLLYRGDMWYEVGVHGAVSTS